jgi:hypothetical protein
MDTRIRMTEFRQFIAAMKKDYRLSGSGVKRKKKKAILKTVRLTFDQIWSGIMAPLIYPIWYVFRKQITNAVYEGTSWEAVHKLINNNGIAEAKRIVSRRGKFIYWLWTFGDLRDPLGRGELPDDGYKGRFKNNFIGRFYENAIRNPRFTINYIDYRTGPIVRTYTIADTRDYSKTLSSEGLGSQPIGMYFKWFVDDKGEWYYVYDDNNSKNMFYFGYLSLGKDEIGKCGRFEIGYRAHK